MSRQTMQPGFAVFAPFSKVAEQADGTLLVHSVINDETVDDQGEIVPYDVVKAASEDYMQWANVREMHEPSAVGTMQSLTHDDATRTTEGIIHVVDPDAVQKVLTGVYKGTSLGGSKVGAPTLVKVGGKTVKRLAGIHWMETSLVDRPSRPTAQLTIMKRSDAPGGDPVSDIEQPGEVADDLAKAATDPAADPAAAARSSARADAT